MTVCNLRSQISLTSKNRAPIHHYASTKFLRPGQSLIFSPRHGHCVVFCVNFFWKCLVLGNLTCAQDPRSASVLRGERDHFIYAHPLDNSKHRSRANGRLRVGRAMFCHAILITRIPWLVQVLVHHATRSRRSWAHFRLPTRKNFKTRRQWR